MKTLITLALLLTFFIHPLFSQTAKQKKQLSKIEQLMNKNKAEKAEQKLITLLEENPTYVDAWDRLADIKYYYYQKSKSTSNLFQNMVVTTTDEDGNKIENDSNANALINLLKGLNPQVSTYNEYKKVLRYATAYSPEAYKCAMHLRNIERDRKEDTTIQEKEKEIFAKAENEFRTKNYNKAAIHYKEALDINPNYYKAFLYLGDSYYMMGNYSDAIEKFKACIERFPLEVEPRKYLVDSYLNEQLYEEAMKAAIASKIAYPDPIANYRMLQSANEINKAATVWPIMRQVLPNTADTSGFTIRKKDEKLPQIKIADYWNRYQEAAQKAAPYCHKSGVFKEKTSLSNSSYLEVYSWEQMLEQSKVPDLETAREMQRLGYLDCYVLITCFHDDFYDQYRHFADNNEEKIIRYYNEVVFRDKE